MKTLFVMILMTVSALPALAQSYPRPCQVAALDSYNRVIAYFYGHTDPRTGMCQDGLRRCVNESRRQGWWGVRCVQFGPRW